MKLTHYLSTLFTIVIIMLATGARAEPSTGWRAEITPYIWAVNLNGTVSVGPTTTKIDESFSDLLKHLDVAGMLYASIHKDQLGIYANAVYASLSDGGKFGPIHVHATNRLGIYGAGISYIVMQHAFGNSSYLQLEPYFGVRYTVNDTSLRFGGINFALNKSWNDPVIGIMANYAFNSQWFLLGIADLGGTNSSTNYTYSAAAILSYRPCFFKASKFDLGYRYLYQHYSTGHGLDYYQWNMNLFGPVAGITFAFD